MESKFEKYKQLGSNDAVGKFYEDEKTMHIGNPNLLENKEKMFAEDWQERLKTRIDNSTVEQRIEFYYADSKYLKAKADRYSKIKKTDQETIAYAKKHSCNSARKRGKSAKEASDAFRKAAELSEEYEGYHPSNQVEHFEKIEEIFMNRLLGMKKAAEVKATDKSDQEYRKGKAELTVYTMLKERLYGLKGKIKKNDITEDIEEYFRKKSDALDAKIEKAVKRMNNGIPKAKKQELAEKKKIAPKSAKKQKNDDVQEKKEIDNLADDYDEEVKQPEELTNNDIINSMKIDEETAGSLGLRLVASNHADKINCKNKNDNYSALLLGTKFIKYTSELDSVNYKFILKPVNDKDKAKAEWNEKWRNIWTNNKEDSVAKRSEMIKQSMEELYKFNLPNPDEVDTEWFDKMYSSKGKYFATILKKANAIDRLSKNNNKAVKEYFENNPEAKAKQEALMNLDFVHGHYLTYRGIKSKDGGWIDDGQPSPIATKVNRNIVKSYVYRCYNGSYEKFKNGRF